MSAQPPHDWNADLPKLAGLRHLRLLTAAACVVLAGCATQESYQLAGPADTDPLTSVGDRSLRSQYLANVRSDPLGAYLAAHDRVSRPSTPPRSLASTALNYLGIKYSFGGDTPNSGFDCSGLVRYAAEKSLGLKLPRRSAEMARLGQSVKRNELERGDLVFFNTRGQRFSHVGIYLGDNKFVHAPSSGSKVRVENMNIGYWQKRYNGARRLASNSAQNKPLAGNSRNAQKVASK
ncbi:C40 family peptidase [Alcaligenaceae bacterium]|nr:C40 family peptidase [Alcaligenaceae bacterium]